MRYTMNKVSFLLIVLLSVSILLEGQTSRSIYVDLGPDDGTNGNITGNPDINGRYWNNSTDPSTLNSPLELIDFENNNSGISMSVKIAMNSGGILGGLLNPDEGLLGDFAIPTATQDYFFTGDSGKISFEGLDPNKGYIFHLFGSRETPLERFTAYTILGLNQSQDTLQTSGSNIGKEGYDGNDDEIIVSTPVLPDGTGKIELLISNAVDGFAYINCLKIVEVDANPRAFIDFGPDDEINGNITGSPDINTNSWNNITDPLSTADSVRLVDQYANYFGGYIKISEDFLSAGINDGGLLIPDEDLLGEFAIPFATQDFFYTSGGSSFTIGGLDTLSGYIFNFFATNENPDPRVTEYTINGSDTQSVLLQTSGADIGSGGYDGNNDVLAESDTIYPDSEGFITINISVSTGDFAYLGAMSMQIIRPPYIPEPICDEINPLGITFMGSSVANGTGAVNMEGYAYQYTQLLENRYAEGAGANWELSNISVGGNNTLDVLARWEEDLLPLCGSYVIYGLSLGNEGLHEFGRPRYEQFRDNMQLLIDKSKEQGIYPVIVNCYTRADFNATDYDYIKRMNLLIHSWDVPSINVLGAIDDGSGRWAEGYEADPFHPNTDGHSEFFYAMVPSLFDAIATGKTQPERVSGTFKTISNPAENSILAYTPDGTVHPFAMTFDLRTAGSGIIGGIETEKGFGVLEIDEQSGALNYLAAGAPDIRGSLTVNDNQWHRITLTHYHAWGKTFLYVDGILEGEITEKIETSRFILSSKNAPTADYREWLIHRSALNEREVMAMVNDSLLKSSLDLYAPLDGQGILGEDELVNLAQTLDTIKVLPAFELPVEMDNRIFKSKSPLRIFPNPASENINFSFDLAEASAVEMKITDISSRETTVFTMQKLQAGTHEISLTSQEIHGNLSPGIFHCLLTVNGRSYGRNFVVLD